MLFVVLSSARSRAREPDTPKALTPERIASQIDDLLEKHWRVSRLRPVAPADDATFLRRLSLDLRGTIPTRQEVSQFLRSRDRRKRSKKITEYLNDGAFSRFHAAQWEQLLLNSAGGARPESAHLLPWLEQAFESRQSFGSIVRELIAGQGMSDENGATGYYLAYRSELADLAGITTQSFLGLQLQCAQCHDHPDEDWTQEDFQGLTGFFRSAHASGRGRGPNGPVFEVADRSVDEEQQDALRRIAKAIRRHWDVNGIPDQLSDQDRRRFRGWLESGEFPSRDELSPYLTGLPADLRQRIHDYLERRETYGTARYLNGKTYQPREGESSRGALAEWVTSPDNPRFARAIMNRLLGHMLGFGAVEPVDNLSAPHDTLVPEVLDLLAEQFVLHETDLRTLVAAIANTRSYGLANSSEQDLAERQRVERNFAAHPLRPLSSQQMFHALFRATRSDLHLQRQKPDQDFEEVQRKLLKKFRYVFSDDEAGTGDGFQAGIPQALFLMNGKITNEAVGIPACEVLEQILQESKRDEDRLREMFYATLNRPPHRKERDQLVRLVRGSMAGHAAGVSDLYWALLNSSEFLTNR